MNGNLRLALTRTTSQEQSGRVTLDYSYLPGPADAEAWQEQANMEVLRDLADDEGPRRVTRATQAMAFKALKLSL